MKIRYSTTLPTGTQFENIKTEYEEEIGWDSTQEEIDMAREKLAGLISKDIIKFSNFKNRGSGIEPSKAGK